MTIAEVKVAPDGTAVSTSGVVTAAFTDYFVVSGNPFPETAGRTA